MAEREQPNSEYQRARLEAAELLGLTLSRKMSAADGLKIDLAVVLRRAIDSAAEDMFAGGAVDLTRLQAATERLISLLPQAELPQQRDDPRAALKAIFDTMVSRRAIGEREDRPRLEAVIATLKAENVELRAALAASGTTVPLETAVITPPLSDIVPPGERAELHMSPGRYADDPPKRPPPPVIDGELVASHPAPDLRIRTDGPKDEPWRPYTHLYE
jgi:hypothetical protein